MTRLEWVEDLTQSVWIVYTSLEWWSWVYNDEENIENCSRKKCNRKQVYKEKVRAEAHNLVL